MSAKSVLHLCCIFAFSIDFILIVVAQHTLHALFHFVAEKEFISINRFTQKLYCYTNFLNSFFLSHTAHNAAALQRKSPHGQ